MKDHAHVWRRLFSRMAAPTPYVGEECASCRSPRIRLFLLLGDFNLPSRIPKKFAELVGGLFWGAIGPENAGPSRIVQPGRPIPRHRSGGGRDNLPPRPFPDHIPGPVSVDPFGDQARQVHESGGSRLFGPDGLPL